MSRLFFLISCILLVPQNIIFLHVETNTTFGYHIGDLVETHVSIAFAEEYILDEAAFKNPGTEVVKNIEFKHATAEKHGNEYDLTLSYQVFIATEKVQEFQLPCERLKFRTTHSGHELEVIIPTRVATISPLLEYPTNVTKTATSIKDLVRKLGFQPDENPNLLFDTNAVRRSFTLLVCLSLALILGLCILVIRDRIHWYHSPFSLAYREIKKLKHMSLTEARVKDELKIFHRAINERSGKTIFLHTLGAFFSILENKNLEEEIRGIFEVSETVIYREQQIDNLGALSHRILKTLKALKGVDRA